MILLSARSDPPSSEKGLGTPPPRRISTGSAPGTSKWPFRRPKGVKAWRGSPPVEGRSVEGRRGKRRWVGLCNEGVVRPPPPTSPNNGYLYLRLLTLTKPGLKGPRGRLAGTYPFLLVDGRHVQVLLPSPTRLTLTWLSFFGFWTRSGPLKNNFVNLRQWASGCIRHWNRFTVGSSQVVQHYPAGPTMRWTSGSDGLYSTATSCQIDRRTTPGLGHQK